MTADFAIALAVSLVLVAAVAVSGARFGPDPWYATLRKPPGLPPRWVFPVVWTTLYILMGLAAARVYVSADAPLRTAALSLYAAQLLANAAWSWLFFGRHRPVAALLDLAGLLALLSFTLLCFLRIDPVAGLLLAPYWVWLWIALYLNAAVWWLNRHGPILDAPSS